MARVNVNMLKIWLSKPDVYPLIGAVAAACGFAVYKGTQHFMSPDVIIDRDRRSADAWEKYSVEEGDAWRQRVMRNYRHKDDALRNLSIFEVFKPSWWQHRAEVAHNPHAATKGGMTTVE